METEIKDYVISSKYVGGKTARWDSSNHNHHVIRVKNKNTEKSLNFDFFASRANPRIQSKEDLLDALNCFIGDAEAGRYDYGEFCSEFGYEMYDESGYKKNPESLSIFQACQKAWREYQAVFDDDIYDFSDNLREIIEKSA